MSKFSFIIFIICFSGIPFAQERLATLPKDLSETSALVKYGCKFLTLNDSGNEPKIYVFNKKGKIKHTATIENVENIDWEAMVYDGEKYLYIGDIGNNANQRKDLAIYKLDIDQVMNQENVKAEIINFNYPEQKAFPPKEKELYYDAESLIIKDNQLMIFTKNRTVPFDGISKVYAIPTEPGTHTATLQYELNLLPTHWREESITDACYFEDELYILTYSKIYMMKWDNDQWVEQKMYQHESWTQKEGIAIDKNYIYLTDENETGIFVGNYLYRQKK